MDAPWVVISLKDGSSIIVGKEKLQTIDSGDLQMHFRIRGNQLSCFFNADQQVSVNEQRMRPLTWFYLQENDVVRSNAQAWMVEKQKNNNNNNNNNNSNNLNNNINGVHVGHGQNGTKKETILLENHIGFDIIDLGDIGNNRTTPNRSSDAPFTFSDAEKNKKKEPIVIDLLDDDGVYQLPLQSQTSSIETDDEDDDDDDDDDDDRDLDLTNFFSRTSKKKNRANHDDDDDDDCDDLIQILHEQNDPTDHTEDHLAQLISIFPDCEENYLREKLIQSMLPANIKVQTIVEQMFESKEGYPKKLIQKPVEATISISTQERTSYTYQLEALDYLCNIFGWLGKPFLRSALFKNESKLVKTWENLNPQYQEQLANPTKVKHFSFLKNCRKPIANIEKNFTDKKLIEEVALLNKIQNDPRTDCDCCCESVILDWIVYCPDGHGFCRNCARGAALAVLENGKATLKCLELSCPKEYTHNVISTFLQGKEMQFYEKQAQVEQLRLVQSELPDLCHCPFCDFAMIIENPDEKLFRCLYPSCLKESCRACKEVAHIPLTCEEYKNEQATSKLKNAVAEQMTEALLRECPKCKRRFYKDEGCNKMVCSCGQLICYICKQGISGYDHFGPAPKCPLHSDNHLINAQAVNTAKHHAIETLQVKVDKQVLKDIDDKIPDIDEKKNGIANPPPAFDPGHLYEQYLLLQNIQARQAYVPAQLQRRPDNINHRLHRRMQDLAQRRAALMHNFNAQPVVPPIPRAPPVQFQPLVVPPRMTGRGRHAIHHVRPLPEGDPFPKRRK